MSDDLQAQHATTGPDGARVTKLGRQFYTWCAPGLLCAIAVLQITLVHTTRLTPWKGGGFGMFSTVDSLGARFVKIYVQTSDGAVATSVGALHTKLLRRLVAAPTEREARLLANDLVRGEWVDVESGKEAQKAGSVDLPRIVRLVTPDEPRQPKSPHVECAAVRVEVWKYRFAPDVNELHAEKILEATASAAERAP